MLLVASVHSPLYNVAALFSFTYYGPHESYKNKNGFPQGMFSCDAREGLPQDCIWNGRLWALICLVEFSVDAPSCTMHHMCQACSTGGSGKTT
jgi:hypothetical protein